MDFNPRSPRGGATAFAVRKICLILQFQSTLPTRGSDFVQNCKRGNMAIRFQSTLPTRGSDDKALYSAVRPFGISIHAPHEGERRISPCGQYPCHAFQSTLPTRGSDGLVALINHEIDGFQSTLPTRGSDLPPCIVAIYVVISIHAPHEGERPDTGLGSAQPIRFQSTLPTRGSDCHRELNGLVL